MPLIPRPSGDPLDEIRALRRRVEELERRSNTQLLTKDSEGSTLVAPDSLTGRGLARPYLSTPMIPVNLTSWQGTTSASFTSVWAQSIYRQHPKLTIVIYAGSETAGTTGEVRVLIGGVPFTDVQAFTANATTLYTADAILVGPGIWPGSHMAPVTVEIQLRRTAGTGTVRAWPALWGVES